MRLSLRVAASVFWLFFGPAPEELGWRGYALDGLQARMNALFASLILGVVWSLWHLPLFFIKGTWQAEQVGLGTQRFWLFMLIVIIDSCLSLVAAPVSARSSAAVLSDLLPSPALPPPHTSASVSTPQTASASCTAWVAASVASASCTFSNASSLANRAQSATSTRSGATPTQPTTRPGSPSARSFIPPPRFRMTLHRLSTPLNYPVTV